MTVLNLERERKLVSRHARKSTAEAKAKAKAKAEHYHNGGKNYACKPKGFKPERVTRLDKVMDVETYPNGYTGEDFDKAYRWTLRDERRVKDYTAKRSRVPPRHIMINCLKKKWAAQHEWSYLRDCNNVKAKIVASNPNHAQDFLNAVDHWTNMIFRSLNLWTCDKMNVRKYFKTLNI